MGARLSHRQWVEQGLSQVAPALPLSSLQCFPCQLVVSTLSDIAYFTYCMVHAMSAGVAWEHMLHRLGT